MRGRRLAVLGLTTMLIAGLAGCENKDSEPVATRVGATTLPPDQVAGIAITEQQIDRAVEEVERLAEELLESSGIPGMAVAVVRNGTVAFQRGFGVRDVETGQPVGPDTVFQLASLSKPIGATVVARQITAGKVTWDTPVRQLAPTFALSDPYVSDHVTIGDLYAHRSGLPDHAGDLLEDLGYDRTQVLQRLRLLPLGPFRDSYAYTNFGVTAAATAVAEAAGTDWAKLSEQALYGPLGMNSTSSRYADYMAAPDRADGHVRVDGEYRRPNPGRQPDAQSPAGGVSSSVADMARWMLMVSANGSHRQQQLVAPEALLPAISPQAVSTPPATPTARTGTYGFGFNVNTSAAGRVVLSHSGAFTLGASTAFTLIPSAGVGIVTLTNAAPIGVPETLNAEFADLVQFGEIRQDWWSLYRSVFDRMNAPTGKLAGATPPADPAPARPLASYAGTYGNAYYGPATVAVSDDELTLTLGPRNTTVPLRHWDGDTFVFTPSGEDASSGTVSEARFEDGTLTLEYYDTAGMGTFTRS